MLLFWSEIADVSVLDLHSPRSPLMKIGLIPPLVSPIATPEYLSAYGRHAEEFGFHSIWLAEEFEAVGMPFERRGAHCNAFLELIKHIWESEVSSWSDELYEFVPCRMYPNPIRPLTRPSSWVARAVLPWAQSPNTLRTGTGSISIPRYCPIC